MNAVPVANQSENKQQECDHQQAGGFAGVRRMTVMLAKRGVLLPRFAHENIVPRGAMAKRWSGEVKLNRE